ncbi:MAG: HAD family hydrolase [Clostridia bacterium]|nr:HAD family hydrolase [Clostridia bacterium]
MDKPSMILFDVGGTLFRDGKCNFRDGLSALRKYALNPDITDDDTLLGFWNDYLEELGKSFRTVSGTSPEYPLSAMIKAATMRAGLKFGIDIFSQEEIFDRFNSTREVKEGIPELLALLKEKGIRTAVISNNAMSGESLALAIKRWIPASEIEFCLTSADLLFSKPHASLFVTAAKYAGLDLSECWYCGDSMLPDIIGSGEAGMSPVLIYEGAEEPVTCTEGYMMINGWSALTQYISEMN